MHTYSLPHRGRSCARVVLPLVIIVCSLVACGGSSEGLTEADRAAIRELREGYTRAWLQGDTAAVLATYAPDAVLIPHLGNPHAEGIEAIRRHFWPPGAPPGRVTAFSLDSYEVRGTGSLAFDRGRYALEFAFEGSAPISVAGNYLAVAEKGTDGRWRWVAYTWNHPPPDR